MDWSTKMSCLLLLFISLVNLGLGSASAAPDCVPLIVGEKGCNGTLGDCFSSGGDMEFLGAESGDLLRHYAAGARWLLQSRAKTSQLALQTRPVCPPSKYSDCVGRSGGTGRTADYNRNKRAA